MGDYWLDFGGVQVELGAQKHIAQKVPNKLYIKGVRSGLITEHSEARTPSENFV